MHANNETSIRLNHDSWAAITTSNQFKALGIYSDFCMNDYEGWIKYDQKLSTRDRAKINQQAVFENLLNSWKTESLLRTTFHQFRNTKSGFLINWAFPQAYYSCFHSTLASFSVTGFREKSNTTVQRKIANLASIRSLPEHMNVWVDGGMNDLRTNGIESNYKNFKSAIFYPNDFENVKRHVMSIFLSTRRAQLEDKKSALNIRTKDGKRKKKVLNHSDWIRVSDLIGGTSWLCILNRKRIQSNYKDVGTFNSDYFDTTSLLVGLIKFTNTFNFANEINILHKMGLETIMKWIPPQLDFAAKRIHFMQNLLNERINHPEAC